MTQSQLAILRVAACTIEEKLIPHPPEQHELVRQGVEHIVEEQAQSGGGQLGGPSGALRRTYERLKQFAVSMQGTLFPPRHLKIRLERPFAALRMTGLISKCLVPAFA